MHLTTRLFLTLSVAGVGAAGTLSAQTPASADSSAVRDTTPTSVMRQPAGPRLDGAATAMRTVRSDESTLLQRRQPQSVGKPMAMMVVGGAAILLGAVIGGDVGTLFMIGGAAGVLIGLYEYLK